MSALEFIQSLCILGTVAGLVVYLTRTVVRQSNLQHKLELAQDALHVVDKISSELEAFKSSASKTLSEHETKLSAMSLKQGMRG
jgi:hypothetical protein